MKEPKAEGRAAATACVKNSFTEVTNVIAELEEQKLWISFFHTGSRSKLLQAAEAKTSTLREKTMRR